MYAHNCLIKFENIYLIHSNTNHVFMLKNVLPIVVRYYFRLGTKQDNAILGKRFDLVITI